MLPLKNQTFMNLPFKKGMDFACTILLLFPLNYAAQQTWFIMGAESSLSIVVDHMWALTYNSYRKIL